MSTSTDELTVARLAQEIGDLINQDGDEVSDGECIDNIVYLLMGYGLYTERK